MRRRVFGSEDIPPIVLIKEVEKTLEYLREMARLTTRRPDPL